METIQNTLETKFKSAIKAAFDIEADPLLTASQNPQFGDYQSNAAMGLAKTLSTSGNKTNPRAVAEQILGKLDLGDMVDQPLTTRDIAGPGFINVKLSTKWLEARCATIASDERLGIPLAAAQKKTVVDYSGPNIAKEMHVGHLRSTIIGDAISRVIEFLGHEVIRQNHIGDWGTQFGMLIAYLRIPKTEYDGSSSLTEIREWNDDGSLRQRTFALSIADLEGFYRHSKQRFDADQEFQATAREAVVKLQGGDSESIAVWRGIVTETRKQYQSIYARLNVKLREEHERGESFYNPFLADVVKQLKEKGLAVESEGATVVFVDGPDKPPMIIEKTGGGYLYATTDLAGVWYRVTKLGAKHIIYTHDSRQANHFRQVFDTARKVGWAGPDVQLDYAPFGTMLGEDGKPFKTRSGDTVKLKDLLDEAEERGYEVAKAKSADRQTDIGDDELKSIGRAIGIGALKYADLSKDRISDYVFSWNKMLAMEGNTGPYMQYAYARIRSIQRKASGSGTSVPLSLESPHELALAKHILRAGEAIELVAHDLKPHLLCTYLYDLATKFSGFYENCPVLQSEEPTRSSRLALCDLTARTLALGLDLLGIEHPERM